MTREEVESVLETLHPTVFQGEKGQRIVTRIVNLLNDSEDSGEEDITSLNRRIIKCRQCNLSRSSVRPAMGVGDPGADVFVVLDLAGVAVRSLLENIGEAVGGTVYLSHAVKCAVPLDEFRRGGNKLGEKCVRLWFDQEVNLIQPRVVVLMGDIASSLILGGGGSVQNDRLSNPYYISVDNVMAPVYVTYHPSEAEDAQGIDGKIIREYEQDLGLVRRRLHNAG